MRVRLGEKNGFVQCLALVDRIGNCGAGFRYQKIGNMGSDLGKAVKGFKDGVKGEEEKKDAVAKESSTIDVQSKEKSGN